jgi:hypothetical protein
VTSFVLPSRRGSEAVGRVGTAALLRRAAVLLGRPEIAERLRQGSDLPKIRRLLVELRRTPFATSLATTLLASTIVLRHVVSDDQDVLRWASTNLDNLTTRPIRSMVFSAVVLPGERWLPYAGAIAAIVAPIERRVGAVRVLAVFASGHVIATLLSEGGVALGIEAGLVPAGASTQMDVGVSYGLWAVGGAALVLLPRRWRLALATAAAGAVAGLLLAEPDHMTAAGHAVSLAIGIGSWPYLRRSLPAGSVLRTR